MAEKRSVEIFLEQVNDLIETSKHFGIKTINVNGSEADDVVSYLINNIDNEKYQVLLLSTDSDLNQLLRPNIVQGSYGKDLAAGIRAGNIPASIFKNSAQFQKESNLTPEKYTLAKILSGDTSDSIAGFDGIGEKTAMLLIEKYGDFQGILNNIETLKVPRLQQKSIDHMKNSFEEITELNYKLINLNWSKEEFMGILGVEGVNKLDAFLVDIDKPLEIDKKAIEELCYEQGRIDIVDKLDFFLHPFQNKA